MKKYKVSETVVKIFGSWEKFRKSINSKKAIKSDYLKEFLRFYDTFAATNYEKYVEFDFKEIPIEKKYNRGYKKEDWFFKWDARFFKSVFGLNIKCTIV
jgi:hypothetical protein